MTVAASALASLGNFDFVLQNIDRTACPTCSNGLLLCTQLHFVRCVLDCAVLSCEVLGLGACCPGRMVCCVVS